MNYAAIEVSYAVIEYMPPGSSDADIYGCGYRTKGFFDSEPVAHGEAEKLVKRGRGTVAYVVKTLARYSVEAVSVKEYD